MSNLSSQAQSLLEILIGEIEQERFSADRPEGFLGYGEVIEMMDLPEGAITGGTHGETLQRNGLDELGPWIKGHPRNLPAITGLIVSKETSTPGSGFFKLYNKKNDDYQWWLGEVARCLDFDWSLLEATPTKLPQGALSRSMDTLERSLIEKAGYKNGFENVLKSIPERVHLASARHKAEATIWPSENGPQNWNVTLPAGAIQSELVRSLPDLLVVADQFQVTGEKALTILLRRAAELAMSLPNQAAEDYEREIHKLEINPPDTTEALRLVKQRIGQDRFRKALLEYWDGACAVTGIAVPELLRASHAKPWADCESDEERLNAYNGFLLCAHLDALFDRGLMTFDPEGKSIFSEKLDEETKQALGLSHELKVRWITRAHRPFLEFHRERVFRE